MTSSPTISISPDAMEQTRRMLHDLGIPVYRNGYRHLCIAIPLYAQTGNLWLSKGLYPLLADYFGYASWKAVERTIRAAITSSWAFREEALWERYFPHCTEAPSNKQFIATLADRLF